MCLPKTLFPVFMFSFIFPPLYYLAANISHFLTVAMKFSCFSSNEIRLPTYFSVIHVSVNIKSSVEKGTTCCCCCCCCFLFKSPGGHANFFRCHGLPYLLIELFCISMPVVRTDARLVQGHVITKFSGTGRFS